ncbi:TetR/AcrR family transcriptional regulator [Flavobacterium silvaticum]|uniref:TetR/AcrR family transcriptional regulator n=1 Tax=Flavobacterium silvaticum TaxID=1852020 RepID=A0A972FLR9_9FLAO|nr:TetR family transcriptional regulator [Flavobacterium silvaticum]NMH27977.1 TetR/AcrR family transcriptional regulator [Flavobacterium silvaticum]
MTTDLNEKQTQILAVAEKLFADKGFDGTSIRDIAKEAGINIAMVSYYFGSKEKMLEALIMSRVSDMRVQLETLQKQNLEPWEKLEKLIELFIARVNKNRCVYQIIHFEFSSKQRSIDFEAFTSVKHRNLETLRAIIGEGQEKGIFRKDVIIELIPTMIIGTFLQFQISRPWYQQLFNLKTEKDFENYVKNQLTNQIKQTIKALLKNEE